MLLDLKVESILSAGTEVTVDENMSWTVSGDKIRASIFSVISLQCGLNVEEEEESF